MSVHIETTLEGLRSLFQSIDLVLSEWTGESNLRFPVLLGMLGVKLNWNEEQAREADPLVRHYVRNHTDWYVTRGAHGGIMRASEKQKKEAVRLAKDEAKQQMTELLAAKMAATNPSQE